MVSQMVLCPLLKSQRFPPFKPSLPADASRHMPLDWRDAQVETITRQLEDAFVDLTRTINAHIAEISSFQVGKAQVNPRNLAATLITPWAEEQSQVAIRRAEASLSDLVVSLDLDSGTLGWPK